MSTSRSAAERARTAPVAGAPEPVTTAGAPAPQLPKASSARPNWWTALPFVLFHAVPLLAIVTGVTVRAVVFGVVAYVVPLLLWGAQ